ncbi:adhesion G protein-coupled receptor E2-like [Oncorhynchus mykiss]|uniref:adhesion G protein-coupled receptor E2-like n=1 Tax=Oncorhynchus mykiss TaxID=8022 RepID=UPI001877EA1C|nr:adhesion G protein-coupled receptor E2-like [Oncorhynchus mykiss]
MSYCSLSLLLGSLFIIGTSSYPNGSCDGYTTLDEPRRNYLFSSSSIPGYPINTDTQRTNIWVRYVGIGGDTVIPQCAPLYYSGVYYPIHLTFTHPQSESETPTTGNACGNAGSCCNYNVAIQVIYCSSGGFYVYRQMNSHPIAYMGYVTYINECEETANLCGPHSNCTNSPGVYNCSCLEGFVPSDPALALNPTHNPCTDVNECVEIEKVCGGFGKCTNTPGNYTCTCYNGYKPDGPFDCQDIDECFNSTICGQESVCTNTPGAHNCTCLLGFSPTNPVLDPSKANPCIDIDECLNKTMCGPDANCTNSYAAHSCTCLFGYLLTSPDAIASPLNPCLDIDECANTPGLCGLHSVCTNAPGTFHCSCVEGYFSSTGVLWETDVTVCESVDDVLAAIVPPEGQSKEMYFLNQMNQQLMENPDIVLPEGKVSGVGTISAQQASTGQGWSGAGKDGGESGSVVLKISVLLVNALVDPSQGRVNKTIHTPELDISLQVMEANSTDTSSLSARGNTMDINLNALARNNNGTASAVFLTVSGMESLLGASFLQTENHTEMLSDVITATLPKINHTQLSEPVNFTMSHKRRLAEPGLMTCVYWEDRGMEYENGTKGRHWSVNGCWVVFSDENYTVCSCSHLSTFALIMQTGETVSEDNPFLEWVNRMCVIVGLVFFALAILTFLLCSWNPKINNTARLHLCLCLFLSHLLLLLDYTYLTHKLVCSVMAGLLHFLVVASFLWMLLEALQLYLLVQRLSRIQVIQREGLQKKYLFLIGYGIPLVIVGVSAAVKRDGYGGSKVCWLKPEQYFTWAVLGPVCTVLALNWILFCVTIWSLRPTLANMKSDVSQSKDTRLIIFKILAQFVILGCTWVLGLFQSTMVFKYLFIVLNSQQGTFLYIVHCLFNKEVRDEYRKWLGCSSSSSTPNSMLATLTHWNQAGQGGHKLALHT